ncbi:MAG: M24 family metallopeptidase [Vicinamibacterales bacterium]
MRQRVRIATCALAFLATVPFTSSAQQTGPYSAARPFGTLRQQAEVQQAWLKERLEVNLPAVMRAHGVDMWVVTMREYNEDPVFRGLVSATTFAARRRSIYVFYDRGPERGVERLALGGTSQGGLYEVYRGEQSTSTTQKAELWGMDQWRLFARLVRERNPKAIGVDISADHNFADGLTVGEWEQMKEALGPELEKRVVRNPRLAIDYLALRVPSMAPVYRRLQAIVHEVIGAAFSNLVITPGETTTADVVWWMRQRVNDMGLGTWFQPSVEIQRMGATEAQLGDDPVIQRGDVLHCDFGITAMGLNTDTQHMGYVLREGETEAPKGLQTALARANRLQDILFEKTKPGLSGNQVLREVLGQMHSEGLDGTMYSHPIGDHGHAAGPLIGLWDYQEGVPGRGDVPVLANMWFSTEMQVTTPVPEWNNQPVRMAVEEEAEVRPDGVMQWTLRRQTELHLVR